MAESGTDTKSDAFAAEEKIELAIQQAHLEHAQRLWDAEEENARRHFNRIRLLAGVSLAVVGLLINALARLLVDAHVWLAAAAVAFFAFALWRFVRGYFQLLNPRRTTSSVKDSEAGDAVHESQASAPLASATRMLLLSGDDLERPAILTARVDAVARSKVRTHAAAVELQRQNTESKAGIELAAPKIARSIIAMAAIVLACVALGPLVDDTYGGEKPRHQEREAADDRSHDDRTAGEAQQAARNSKGDADAATRGQ